MRMSLYIGESHARMPYNCLRGEVSELADEHDLGLPIGTELISKFLDSRRQGTSPHTVVFYRRCLRKFFESGHAFTCQDINRFLANLHQCNSGGKHAYFRAIRVFSNWAFRQGHFSQNPIRTVDAPKVAKKILPSLTSQQVEWLMQQADNLRDRCIISLLADSGLRLAEVASISSESQIDWDNNTATVWGKGNKERRAPFSTRTAKLLCQWFESEPATEGNIWGLERRGIQHMLNTLKERSGLPCNAHTFRRTFASLLHKAGVDIEHIMRLGGWETLDMVLRYTRSVRFEDSLSHYRSATESTD